MSDNEDSGSGATQAPRKGATRGTTLRDALRGIGAGALAAGLGAPPALAQMVAEPFPDFGDADAHLRKLARHGRPMPAS